MKKVTTKPWLTIMLFIGIASASLPLQAKEATDCASSSAKTLNKAAQPYDEAIRKAAERYDVQPTLIKAVMAGGSCFDPVKVSPNGALGLMQLLPATAYRFGAMDITDPAANIDAGTRYLSYLLKRYAGDITTVLAAHAADEGWEGSNETLHSSAQDIQEPVSRTLDILLKLDNRKKANRQAKALLKSWKKSAKAYQQALLASPQTRAHEFFTAWYKARMEKVHYPRTADARSCGGFSAKTLASKAAPYETLIQKAAKRHGVNTALIKSVIAAESCYREMVVSPKGASGLMQLMPETAAELGVMDIFDPEENINAGTRYLGWLIRYYGGSYTHAIAAYNAGPGRILQGVPVTIEFAETRSYINTVLTHLTRLETDKKSAEQAQLLLADWRQAELVYQAVLGGETLPPSPTEEMAASESTTTENMPATGQPALILASYREVKTADSAQPIPVTTANIHLLPTSASQDIVRIKRITSTVIATEPVATPSVQTSAETLPPATQPQAAPPTALPDCSAMPAPLTAQTQQQGNGRYTAFFYTVESGETLETIAKKLAANVQDIIRLNNLQPDVTIRPGSRFRVAECTRSSEASGT